MGLLSLHLGLEQLKDRTIKSSTVSSSLLNHYFRLFRGFENKTQSFHCMTLSSLSIYVVFVDPYQRKLWCYAFLFLQLKLIWSSLEWKKHERAYFQYNIVKSNLGSKKSWVIQSNQDVHLCECMVYIWWLTYFYFATWKLISFSRI